MKHLGIGVYGFTVLELLVTVSIVSVLSQMAYTRYVQYSSYARAAQVASNMRNFASAFRAYELENRDYPAETENTLPPEMVGLILKTVFEAETAVGGRFDWQGPDTHPYAGIAIINPSNDDQQLSKLDRLLDDGDLTTGIFKSMPDGRITYLLE